MPTGPRGEKRPVSPVSSMVKAMKVSTGIEDEEYADGKPRAPVGSSFGELEGDHLQMAAREVAKPAKSKKAKKSKAKNS